MLRVHQSNFRQLGFVEDVPIEALCELGVPVIDDVGSGALDARCEDEPTVQPVGRAPAPRSCASPATSCSAGRRPGCSSGRADAVEAARRHPLARALRIDKLSLAALEATLRLHRDAPERDPGAGDAARVARDARRARAERLAAAVGGEVVEGVARVGGGALPLLELPGPVVALAGRRRSPPRCARGDPPRARPDRGRPPPARPAHADGRRGRPRRRRGRASVGSFGLSPSDPSLVSRSSRAPRRPA